MLDLSVDPARALWALHGRPLAALPWQNGEQTCSRCKRHTCHWVRIADVVSDRFTGWDTYANGERAPRWCQPCAWAHSEPRLRHYPWVIVRDLSGACPDDTPHLSFDPGSGPDAFDAEVASPSPAGASALRRLLSAPLRGDVAVVVPLSRKKHLLPDAAWGLVRTDEATLRWDQGESERLEVLLRLRAMGFSEAALAERAPRFEHLLRCDPADQREALSTWSSLDPWRAFPPLMAVAVRAARTERP